MSGRDTMLVAGALGPQRGVRTRWATWDQTHEGKSNTLLLN